MADTFKGATGPKQAEEVGFHAEVLSDGERAVLSLLNLKTQVWSMAIIENGALASNGACLAYAIRAAMKPDEQGAVTEDENEEYFDRCLALEESLKGDPAAQVDVDDEEEDQDNDYL
ncbi:hypothetical protein [Methyloferula stellata]|uniref:hypothetical protein n=1 Tax=Methyloferula stellata TaxID=876270 RepID=UPI00036CFA66|nr:hypothetical protein [Methyloferula stellata]